MNTNSSQSSRPAVAAGAWPKPAISSTGPTSHWRRSPSPARFDCAGNAASCRARTPTTEIAQAQHRDTAGRRATCDVGDDPRRGRRRQPSTSGAEHTFAHARLVDDAKSWAAPPTRSAGTRCRSGRSFSWWLLRVRPFRQHWSPSGCRRGVVAGGWDSLVRPRRGPVVDPGSSFRFGWLGRRQLARGTHTGQISVRPVG